MSCYIIKSKLSGLVLDVEGQGGSGSKVIPWERHGRDNQLWYDDPATGTIRAKYNHCALTTENDHLYVKDYQPGNPNQNWCRQGDAIMNRTTNKVLDVYNENKEKGAQIGPYAHNKGINQQWEFEMTGGPAPQSHSAPGAAAQSPYYQGQKKEFHIESEMNGKVLDICEGKKEPGIKILMWKKHHANEKNQLFYLDGQGFIRSSLNDLCIYNGAKGQGIVTAQPSGDPRAHFQFQGNRVVNQLGECLDICRKNDKDGAEVITWDNNDGKNQHWRQNFI